MINGSVYWQRKQVPVAFLPEQLIQYRKHRGSNSSKRIGLFRKIHYINEMKKQMKHRINKDPVTFVLSRLESWCEYYHYGIIGRQNDWGFHI
jgi:hypothetical protein